jgi:hypothetical protein
LLEPGSLNDVLARRLDLLGELKPLAQAAATVGLEFELRGVGRRPPNR